MNLSFDVHLGEPFLEMLSMYNLAHFTSQVAKGREKKGLDLISWRENKCTIFLFLRKIFHL
jgi:hypothetical protein